ncbi:MAG: TauD/TfdA family dioxygenase [Gammaproteobacteria bacterium]|jgi:hypothetical protein|nr:TauD/TfdA family dioxygenase [Gammaproteobacteria bacterium]
MSPFSLEDERAYRAWRAAKLAGYPGPDDLWVEIADPARPSEAEIAAVLGTVERANLALFRWRRAAADPAVLATFLASLGLNRLDRNPCAEEDGITALEVRPADGGRTYIPYTNRPLSWHTDGYYNDPANTVRSWALYCVSDAAAGGENEAWDHELAYIRLRDANPAWIRALMAPDAMTIPANEESGAQLRPARTGPVFAVDPDGHLNMRYSARAKNIAWKDEPETRAAVEALGGLFSAGDDHILGFRLAPGEGVVSNNVLHRREGFRDDPASGRRRLILRARYHDRVGSQAGPHAPGSRLPGAD